MAPEAWPRPVAWIRDVEVASAVCAHGLHPGNAASVVTRATAFRVARERTSTAKLAATREIHPATDQPISRNNPRFAERVVHLPENSLEVATILRDLNNCA